MSHYLRSVKVLNYRSIALLTAHLSPLSPLVGQNNAGKSNLLNAIQWLISPSAIDPKDIRNKEEPIIVEAAIEGITEALLKDALYGKHAERIRPRLVNESLSIRRRLPPGQVKAKDAVLEIQDPATGEWDNPTGIDAAISNLFPEPVRIDAMVDAPEDVAKTKTSTTLGKLIAQLTKPIAEQHGTKVKEVLDQLDALMSASGADRPAELATFDQEATSTLQSYFPGLSLVIDFPAPQLPDLLKAGTVRVKEGDGSEARDFTSLGHGAQRSIHMAMVQLLAKRSRGTSSSPRCTLLLIDEPELFLHPQAIEQVRLSLRKLSESGYQVIFSTHTPLMLGRDEIRCANIVTKLSAATGTIVNPRAQEAVRAAFDGDAPSQAKTLFDLSNAKEVLFAKRVLLVEGHSEYELLPGVYEALVGRPLAADRLGIVRMNSCGDLPKALEVLSRMGIEARALADLDFAFIQAPKAKLVAPDDPHRESVRRWFVANQSDKIVLSPNGWPNKEKSEGGAEGAFRKMASDPANAAAIQSLHQHLKTKNIWVWCQGSFEQVLGLEPKNDHRAMADYLHGLQSASATIAERTACEAFCQWLTA